MRGLSEQPPPEAAPDPQDLGVPPRDPAELASWDDDRVQRFYRSLAFAARHSFDRMVELELIGRFTVALRGFSEASDRASRRLLIATWVLVGLTVAIVGLTVALLVDAGGGASKPAQTVTVPVVGRR